MNLESKEFYINMKEKDIPFWNPLYSYDDQDDDVKQFWNNEAVKLMNGVTVNGVYIHPWLYWHLNFWKMMLDVGDDRIPGLSELRDNEWFFAEILKQAEEENKGIFMFGTRRFGKALLNSEIVYMEDKEMRICDLQIGDRIYDESGKLVTVEGVYPQGKVFTYRVKFEDGRNVICCGDHLWRVMYKGVWFVKTLKNIIMSDFNNMYIPISEAIDYKERRLPLNPSAYGTMLAAHLMSSSGMDILYDANVARQYLRSSIRQKKEFTESFIRAFQGVVTDDEKIQVSYEDMDVIRFVQRMFWAYGWYAKYEKGVLALTSRREGLRISSIEVYGKYDATCIRVSNDSHLFLTTNYVVTHNSAIMSSLLARNATLTYNLSHNVLGSSKEDLMNLSEYLEFGLDNLPPFLKINRTGNDWSKEVILGVRNTRNERDVHARIRITNLNSGQTSASLKPAGNTPYTSIYDEVGKFPFLEAYLAGLPAHKMKGRMRGMIIASGCVVKDTVIYEGYKKKIKVQDVKLGSLIIGYNKTTMATRKNRVEWVKPPAEKLCFRIRASKFGVSKMLDCSYDHPFLCKEPNGRDRLYEGYVPAIRLVPGDKVAVVDGGVGTADWFTVESVRQLGMREVYNVRVDGTSNYLANDFVTHNTGGNVEKSRDAQKVMNNPSQYGFIVMDYSLLGKHTMNPTWRICKSGIFVPGQMSHAYEKKKTNLAEYLGVKNANSLKKISIQVTDFDKTTKAIQSRLDELAKGDRELFVQEKMAYPLTVDDCFLNSSVNRFPVDDAMIHKNRLLEEGRRGKAVTIYQVDNKKIGWNFSDKQIAPYPFKGGNIDSPVIIYEDPPEQGGDLSNYVYAAGCLLPGEEVLTDSGWKKVEDVTFSDKLVNKDGDIVPIRTIFKHRKERCDVYSVTVGNGISSVRFTEEHPIYVSKQVKKGSQTREDLFDFSFKKVSDVSVTDWIKYPNVYAEEIDLVNEMCPFKGSVDFWWLMGYFLGNGWTSYPNSNKNVVNFSLNKNDIGIIDRLKDVVRRIFGKNIHEVHKERNERLKLNTCELEFSYKELCVWIYNVFGKYALKKRIPEFVKRLRRDYKISFLHGYLDSDGNVSIHTKGYFGMEFVSANLDILESVQDMFLSLGISGNISMFRKGKPTVISGVDTYSKDCYHLRIGDNGTHEFRDMVISIYPNGSRKINRVGPKMAKQDKRKRDCFVSDDNRYVYFQVKKIEKEVYTGIVYNFECDTHTYLCRHITTHNCDPYKSDKSSTESLGAFYIFKRMVGINDSFANKIVASYVSRPPSSDDFCRVCEMLQEAYGAMCLMENADRMYEMYLARRNKDVVLLEDGERLANKIIRPGTRQNNRLGLPPTVPNQRMLFNAVIQYCWEPVVVGYTDEGEEITQKGIYRIDDIELLEEIIAFGPNVNTDRIIAFGHALLLARYYDDMNYMPNSSTQKANEEKRSLRRYSMGGFSTVRHNPFTVRNPGFSNFVLNKKN